MCDSRQVQTLPRYTECSGDVNSAVSAYEFFYLFLIKVEFVVILTNKRLWHVSISLTNLTAKPWSVLYNYKRPAYSQIEDKFFDSSLQREFEWKEGCTGIDHPWDDFPHVSCIVIPHLEDCSMLISWCVSL